MPNKHKHIRKVKSRKKKDLVDRLIYPATIATPIMTLPQVYSIWVDGNKGASVITWFSYTVISAIWLAYALKIKDKPLITLEICGVILYGLIFLGLVVVPLK